MVAALEAAQALEKNTPAIKLSEQQIIDCTMHNEFRNYGCMGGSLERTFRYAQSKPIIEDKYYPYIGGQNTDCFDENKRQDHEFA